MNILTFLPGVIFQPWSAAHRPQWNHAHEDQLSWMVPRACNPHPCRSNPLRTNSSNLTDTFQIAAHINGKVNRETHTYEGGITNHVGQVFFPEDTLTAVETVAPYNTNEVIRLRNAEDGIFVEENTGYNAVSGMSPPTLLVSTAAPNTSSQRSNSSAGRSRMEFWPSSRSVSTSRRTTPMRCSVALEVRVGLVDRPMELSLAMGRSLAETERRCRCRCGMMG